MQKEITNKYVLFLILVIFSVCVEKLALINLVKAMSLGIVCGLLWELSKWLIKIAPLRTYIIIAILLGCYFAYFNEHVFPQSSAILSLYGGFLVSEIISDISDYLRSKQ